MTMKWTNFPSWMSYLTKYVTRETELCKVLNRILGVTYYPAGWKILLVIYLHFLKQHYSGCFSEVLNFIIGEKNFEECHTSGFLWGRSGRFWKAGCE